MVLDRVGRYTKNVPNKYLKTNKRELYSQIYNNTRI